MEHITDLVRVAPMVQILDAPVPQMVDKLHDVLQFFDRLSAVPEAVIAVPKIFIESVPMRALRATQLVEQLVEVPTTVSYPMLVFYRPVMAQRTEEQTVDAPVPHGGWHDLSPSSADFSNPPDTANQGVFRTCPRLKKVRRSRALSSARVPRESSSWPP